MYWGTCIDTAAYDFKSHTYYDTTAPFNSKPNRFEYDAPQFDACDHMYHVMVSIIVCAKMTRIWRWLNTFSAETILFLDNSIMSWLLIPMALNNRQPPWASYEISCGLCMRWECRERFSRQRKPLVSDPSMHHCTCVTHVAWWMSGSLTRGGGENVPSIPGACATRNFINLARGPWYWLCGKRVIVFHEVVFTYQCHLSRKRR